MREKIVKNCFILCSLFIVCCFLPGLSFGADTAKFGSVDIQKLLNESDAGKKAKSELESLIKSKQSVINDKEKTVEKLKADLEKQTSVLSADARKSKEDELEKQVREYQRLVQDSQAEVKKKEAELTDAILKDVKELIDKIGEQEGYALIVEKSMVIYASQNTDITDIVMKKINGSKSKK
jgi:outer membrane protein